MSESSAAPELPVPSRRALLQGLAALAAAGLVPEVIAQTPAQLSALSKPLTGFAYDDAAIAQSMVRAMTAAFGAQPLQKIASIASSTPASGLAAALREAGLDTVAPRVVVALYSGVVDTPSGPVVFAYNDALAWRAVPWTKPNAVCGGATDYWAAAPSESR
jgi:hypothetical protein